MRIEAQNVLGTAQFDALSAIDFLFPRGLDHHEMFAGVPVVEKAVASVARHLAGLGTLPERVPEPPARAVIRHCDLVVVGAGPAGLALTRIASEAGLSVEVIDENASPGGRLLGQPGNHRAWLDETMRVLSLAKMAGKVTLHNNAVALGAYRDHHEARFLAVRHEREDDRLSLIYAQKFALCPGGAETMPLFEGNDLPGVFAARGLLKLIYTQGVVPGERAVVHAENDEGLAVAEALERAGVEIVAVIDPRGVLQHSELRVLHGKLIKASDRRGRLSRCKVLTADGKTKALSCELLACSMSPAPSFELARQLGLRADFVPGLGFAISSGPGGVTALPHVFVAGEVQGPCNVDEAIERGRSCGRLISLSRSASANASTNANAAPRASTTEGAP
jgi:sarcosine oxidase subunit alpha